MNKTQTRRYRPTNILRNSTNSRYGWDRYEDGEDRFLGFEPTRDSRQTIPAYTPPTPLHEVYGMDLISEILPNQLWQSGSIEPRNMNEIASRKIDMVINMCGDTPLRALSLDYPFTEIQYPIGDGSIVNVDMSHIHEIAFRAANHIKDGGRVLSHCQMGWNRSGLVTGLTMIELGFKGNVVKHIQNQRSTHALGNQWFSDYVTSYSINHDSHESYLVTLRAGAVRVNELQQQARAQMQNRA